VSFGRGFTHPLVEISPPGSPAISAFSKGKIILDCAAIAHLRYYTQSNTNIVVSSLDSRAGNVTEWSQSTTKIVLDDKYSIWNPIYAESNTNIVFDVYDKTLHKVEGGGPDIYDADCNLIQENVKSIQILSDLYVDDQGACAGGVRIGDEPPSVTCSLN